MNLKPGHIATIVIILGLILFVTGGGKITAAVGALGNAEGGKLDGEVLDADCAPESFTAWYHPGRDGSSHFTRKYNTSMPSYGRGGDMQCPL